MKTIEYKPIYFRRGLFDYVQIGVAKLVVEKAKILKGQFFDQTEIVSIEISEPFKSLLKEIKSKD